MFDGVGFDTMLVSVDFAIGETGTDRVRATPGAGDIRTAGTWATKRFEGNDGSIIVIGGGGIEEALGGDASDFFVLAAGGAPAGLRIRTSRARGATATSSSSTTVISASAPDGSTFVSSCSTRPSGSFRMAPRPLPMAC